MHAWFLDPRRQRRSRLRNLAQTALIVAGIAALFAAVAWLIGGWSGVKWGLVGLAAAFLFTPRVSPGLVLRLYGAEEIPFAAFPEIHLIVRDLARRAELPEPPSIWYVKSSVPTAFTVGGGSDSAMAVTDGLLRILDQREFAAVVAHEISHVRHHDLWIMSLADAISRFTRILGFMGVFLLLASVPMWLTQSENVPWLAGLVLVFAPTLGTLMQLALSRSREFDADMGAVELTGDPVGLARALEKLERYQSGPWSWLLPRRPREAHPSALRTHPTTEERIERLMSLYEEREVTAPFCDERLHVPSAYPVVHRDPRHRFGGFWY